MMKKHAASASRAVTAALLVAWSAGCGPIGIMLPYYSSEPIPDPSAYVPSDFGRSGEEVLATATILSASTPRFGQSRTTLSRPVIVRRNELSSLKRNFNARAKGGPMGFGTAGWADETLLVGETLLHLCLVAADGNTLTLSGHDGQGWSDVRQGVLGGITREAMIDALSRDEPRNPHVFGWPCAGTMHWGEIERGQVADFIRGIRP